MAVRITKTKIMQYSTKVESLGLDAGVKSMLPALLHIVRKTYAKIAGYKLRSTGHVLSDKMKHSVSPVVFYLPVSSVPTYTCRYSLSNFKQMLAV